MKKIIKHAICASLSVALLAGCHGVDESAQTPTKAPVQTKVRFATFNISFDRTAAGMLRNELILTRESQSALLARYQRKAMGLTDAEKITAQHVQQMRNVAEIIQRTRPDVIVLDEFDNNGQGGDTSDLQAFNANYLNHAQNSNVKPISYPVMESFATNTGLMSDYDLNNDSKKKFGADDAWGHGKYHGQYAFAMLSRYPVDEKNIRTFQKFKWKDMPSAHNPIITQCGDVTKIPKNRQCGEPWYDPEAWENYPLSSKNHVDVPVRIKTASGEQVIHFLLSHPTPPVFDSVAKRNVFHNSAEIKFWIDYVQGEQYMVDDQGKRGGLADTDSFVIAGDLNADPELGDGDLEVIKALRNLNRVNQLPIPVSEGGIECLSPGGDCKRNHGRLDAQYITNTSGLQLDHLLPSANLNVVNSGIFWPSSTEDGHYLVYKKTGDKVEVAKGVSSDHRMVWADLLLD